MNTPYLLTKSKAKATFAHNGEEYVVRNYFGSKVRIVSWTGEQRLTNDVREARVAVLQAAYKVFPEDWI